MRNNKKIIIQLIVIILASLLSAVITAYLSTLSSFYVFISITVVFSIALLGTYWHMQKILHIVDLTMKKMSHYVPFENSSSKNGLVGVHFSQMTTFKKYAEQFEIYIKNTMIEQVENEMKLKELERVNVFKNQTLDTLLKVNHLFINFNDSKEYYDVILASAIAVVEKASKGSLLLYNPETEKYEYVSCVGYNFMELKQVSMSLEETFLFINSHGNYDKPVIIRNIRAFDNEFLDPERAALLENSGGLDVEEVICAPIVIDNQIYAILNIDSDEKNAFDALDVQLMYYFSSQVAIALKNKYLVDETVNMSRYDKLTGAFNRNYFEKRIVAATEKELAILEPYAVVLCDLNYLKHVNDTYGHGAGDMILKSFSEMLQDEIRDSDAISRIGGDEFIILLKGISHTKAEEKMARVFEKLKHTPLDYHGHKLCISFSYGIASSPDDSMIYDILVKIADLRMYEFKERYKRDFPYQPTEN